MTQLDEVELLAICEKINPAKAQELMALFLTLADEEAQVTHQHYPKRIVKRLSEHIDEYLEG
jgi:hypothetical protein